MDSNPFTLREGKFIFWIGLICGAINIIILAFAILSTISQQNYVGAWFCGVVFGGFALLGAILILAQLRRKLYISLENCEYTNIIGHKKAFLWSDISYAKQSLTNLTYSLRLFNKDDKRIVQIENTMTDADRLLALLRDQGIEIISPLTEMEEHLKQYEITNNDNHTCQIHNKATIRKMNFILLGISIISIILYFFVPNRFGLGFLTLAAILPYVLMLIYPQTILPNISNQMPEEWKQNHVEFAYVAYILPLIFIIFTIEIINFISWVPALIFGAVLYVLLCTLYFVRTPKYLLGMGNAFSIMVFLLMFCFAGTYSINYALNFHKSTHESVIVLDTRVSKGGSPSYYVELQRPNGMKEELCISKSVYVMANDGNQLRRCLRKSIFGISFVTLHK